MADTYIPDIEDGLKKVIAMDWETLIPGHPGPGGKQTGTKDNARDQLAYLQDLSAAVKQEVDQGKSYDDAVKDISLPKYAAWPNRSFPYSIGPASVWSSTIIGTLPVKSVPTFAIWARKISLMRDGPISPNFFHPVLCWGSAPMHPRKRSAPWPHARPRTRRTCSRSA